MSNFMPTSSLPTGSAPVHPPIAQRMIDAGIWRAYSDQCGGFLYCSAQAAEEWGFLEAESDPADG